MFSIAICDDDQVFIDYEKEIITKHLSSAGIMHTIKTFTSSELFISNLIQLCTFDLILLDVEMPEISGVEIAERIRRINANIKIAFVSAFIDYSTVGYMVNAFRYILKKADDLQFFLPECLDSVLKEISEDDKIVKFYFSIGEREIKVKDILYVESRINNVVFKTVNVNSKEILQIRSSLKNLNRTLDTLGFVSINPKFSVNLKHIISLSRYDVALDNGEKLKVSQKKYNEVNKKYTLYKAANL